MKKIEIKIEDYSATGSGVGRVEDLVYFVDKTVVGDKILAEIIKKKKNYAIAKKIDIIEKSPLRIKSDCKYFEQCGGCSFRNISYNDSLEFKKNYAKDILKKFADIKNLNIEIEGMYEPYYYRNHVQLKIKDKKIGYFNKQSNNIIDIDDCLIAPRNTREFIKVLKKYPNGFIEIGIRENNLGEYMIILVGKDEPKNLNTISQKLLEIGAKSIYFSKRRKNGHRYSDEITFLAGEKNFYDSFCDIKVKVSPKSFLQTNRIQAEKIYNQAINFLELKNIDTFTDIYCGMGIMTLMGAKLCKKGAGIESSKSAIADANFNKALNAIENVKFYAQKAEIYLERNKIDSKKIILDPPRKGCDKLVLDRIIDSNCEKLAYISCNVATLARDLKILKSSFEIKNLKLYDMFPFTAHTECIALLERK
ncbi:MAG: class I SAM-dependent RNA methyltransferase [Tissierellia bacterium]|nr:class I SAM-dependent RNA methyltransferase [Tissierellia bacterium]